MSAPAPHNAAPAAPPHTPGMQRMLTQPAGQALPSSSPASSAAALQAGWPQSSLPRDRDGRRVQVIAFVLGDLDRRRPEKIIIRIVSRFGRGPLDHLAADLKPDHPLLLLRVPVYGGVANFHHGTFLHEGLRNGLFAARIIWRS